MCKFFFCWAGIWLVFLFGTVAFASRGFEKIMYIGSDSYDRSQIFCINPDGSNLVQLTSVTGKVGVTQFTVNPQGTKIAYLACDVNGDTILYSIDSDGGNLRRITQTGIGSDSDPVFDIDGKTIYVQKTNRQIDAADISGLKRSKFKDKLAYCQIMSVNKTTGDIIAIKNNSLCKIAKDGTVNIINVTGAHKVTSTKDKLAFDKFTDNMNIFSSDLDGNNIKQLTDDGNCNYDPAFSPDGSKVSFCAYDIDKSNPGLNGVFVINADGTGYRQLIRTNKRPINTVWAILNKEPKIAPDIPDWPNYWEKIIHPPQPDLMIGTNAIAFTGKGQFDNDGKQRITSSIRSRRIITYYIRLVNAGSMAESFKLTASGSHIGWKCTYFRNTTNISFSLGNSTGLITPPIAAGDSYDFRVEVTPESNVRDDENVIVNVYASSIIDPQICDMVSSDTTKSGK